MTAGLAAGLGRSQGCGRGRPCPTARPQWAPQAADSPHCQHAQAAPRSTASGE